MPTFRIRARSLVSVVALVAALVLALPSSAPAATTNAVPNGDFETAPCGFGGSDVCGWNPLPGATISWDATNPRTGLHSMRLTGPGPSIEVTTISNLCIQVVPGTYSASFWYRTTDADANQVALGANWYPNSTCTVVSNGVTPVRTLSPVTNGTWQQVTGTLTFPATTGSVFFDLFEGCNSCGTSTLTVNFDDVDVEVTLGATIASFRAIRASTGVTLRWRTGTESNELGFNVYRQVGARRVRVNRRVLPALGRLAGASYSFVDRAAPRHKALRYWLQDVDVRGNRTWHGPLRVAAA
jgi:hypothetical protein